MGAWESVVSHTSSYFCWKESSANPAVQWGRLRAAWPFLWHHLRNTAYFVAIAVWNGDRDGLEHYVDCLLRWPDRLAHDLERDYFISDHFFSSDLLEMEWTAVGAKLATFRSIDFDGLKPQSVFSSLIENAWRDVVWITSGVMLGWLADGKASQELTKWALTQLRAGEPLHDQEFYGRRSREPQEDEIRPAVPIPSQNGTLRSPLEPGGYAAHLNGVVQFLDVMSERDVIPGRIFRPTTRHDLHDLRLVFSALLLMAIDQQSTNQADERISTFIDRVEAYFADDGLRAEVVP